MTGRHNSHRGGRYARESRSHGGTLAVAVLVVAAAGGGVAWVALRHTSADAAAGPGTCPNGTVTLTVAASPDLAGVVNPLLLRNPVPCAQVSMVPTDSAEMAHFLSGTATASDITAKPDIWIPDTSLWLQVARSTDRGKAEVPATGSSVADSPTVVASPKPVADLLSKQASFSWEQLVDLALAQAQANPSAAGGGPQIAIADPAHDGSGLSAVIVLDRLLSKSVDNPQLKVGITGFIKGMSNNVAPSLTTLLAKLPASEATGASVGGVMAFPASEQKVWQYNNGKPPVPLTALYPSDGSPSLDYPLVLLSGADNAHAQAADAFRTYLQTTALDTLQHNGFRAPDGGPGPVIPTDPGLAGDRNLPPTLAEDGTAQHALALWDSLNKQLRMLSVVDVSGSMGQVVPGTNGQTRLQLTAGATAKAMALFGPRAQMGLWTFTTKSRADGGGTEIDRLLPIAELGAADPGGGTHGQHMIASYAGLTDKPGSRNGLYDVLLAAYQEVHKGWDPQKVNTVVVFTDGKDDNLNSMTSDQLITKLQAATNPAQPVRVFVVALGADVDLTLLNKITAVTGGAAVHFSDLGQMTSAILGSTTTQ